MAETRRTAKANISERIPSKKTRRAAIKVAKRVSVKAEAAPSGTTRIAAAPAAQTRGASSRQRAPAKALLKVFGAAVKRHIESGQPVGFTVVIDHGAVKIRAADPKPMNGPVENPPAIVDTELDRALADARARGRHRVAEILREPDMLSADSLARLLGTTRATINTWRQNRQILALEGAARGYRFPSWQVGEDGKPFAALPQLFKYLGDSSWAVYRFLVQSHPELDGETGRDALKHGRFEEALEAAQSVAEAFT